MIIIPSASPSPPPVIIPVISLTHNISSCPISPPLFFRSPGFLPTTPGVCLHAVQKLRRAASSGGLSRLDFSEAFCVLGLSSCWDSQLLRHPRTASTTWGSPHSRGVQTRTPMRLCEVHSPPASLLRQAWAPQLPGSARGPASSHSDRGSGSTETPSRRTHTPWCVARSPVPTRCPLWALLRYPQVKVNQTD